MEDKIIVRMAILPNLIYRFNIIPVKIPAAFAEIDPLILRFIWKYKSIQKAKTMMEKNKELSCYWVSKLTVSVIETVIMDWQWNRIEYPEISPYIYD